MPDLGNWGQLGRITLKAAYGEHIALRCKNHPHLRWSTKNIAPIGARSIFFFGNEKGELITTRPDGGSELVKECDCDSDALEMVPIEGPDINID